jgi:ferric-dicitrate binding protein FerR (iron transport regulator)
MKSTHGGEPPRGAGGRKRGFEKFLKSALRTEPVQPTDSVQSGHPFSVVGLVLVATAAVMIALTAFWVAILNKGPEGRLIVTGAHESNAAQFADRSVVSVEANTTVRVNVTEQQRSAHVIGGAVTFDVPAMKPPFWVETSEAQVRVTEASRFRVAVSATVVDIEMYEGAVMLYERDVPTGAPGRWLKKGDFYHKPAKVMAALVAEPAGHANGRPTS